MPADTAQNHHIEGLQFGTRGGILINHQFPADGEYTFRVKGVTCYFTAVLGQIAGEQLEDVANAAGVPSRTLLENFRRFRNVSPIRNLRDVRLDKARTLLLTHGAERRVAEIAAECGFAHLSRFAQDYQARFGEVPSKSAARAKQVERRQA